MSAYIENNTLSVLNPITKETIDSISISSKEDINKSQKAFKTIIKTTLK